MTIEEKCLEIANSNLSTELKLELIGTLIRPNYIPYQITYYPTREIHETDNDWWYRVTCGDTKNWITNMLSNENVVN
jgi:hypothetical protein